MKKSIFLVLVFFLCCYYVNAACTVPTVGMSINSDTTFCSDWYRLNATNTVSGVSFTTGAAPFTLDCNGSILVGNYSDNSAGLAFNGVDSHITVKNCTLSNFSAAVSLTGTPENISLQGLTIYDNKDRGILVQYTAGHIGNNSVTNSTFWGTGDGVDYLTNAAGFNVTNSTFSGAGSDYGLYMRATNTDLVYVGDSTFYNITGTAIYVSGMQNVTLKRLTIHNTTGTAIQNPSGNFTLTNSIILTNSTFAINLLNSYSVISGNYIRNGVTYGISASVANYSVITNNTIVRINGISLGGHNNTITHNLFSNMSVGMRTASSTAQEVKQNNISYNRFVNITTQAIEFFSTSATNCSNCYIGYNNFTNITTALRLQAKDTRIEYNEFANYTTSAITSQNLENIYYNGNVYVFSPGYSPTTNTYIAQAKNIEIKNNTIRQSASSYTCSIIAGENNTIANNSIGNLTSSLVSASGLISIASNNSIVRENTIYENNSVSITLASGDNLTVSYNSINGLNDTNTYGISIGAEGSVGSITNNNGIIEYNSFNFRQPAVQIRHNMLVGYGTSNTTVRYNNVTGGYFGIVNKGSIATKTYGNRFINFSGTAFLNKGSINSTSWDNVYDTQLTSDAVFSAISNSDGDGQLCINATAYNETIINLTKPTAIVNVGNNATLTLVNTTINMSKVTLGGNGTLSLYWYVRINTSNISANINITDKNLINRYTGVTNVYGIIENFLLTEFVGNSTVNTTYSNYTLTISTTGYNDLTRSFNLTRPTVFNVVLTAVSISSIVESASNTMGIIFAAFAVIALFCIVGAIGFIIMTMREGGDGMSVILNLVIIAILVIIGYYIIGALGQFIQ